MPLFICKTCGCIEHTALGEYWVVNNKENVKCSECAYGKWHGRFDKIHWKDYIKENSDCRILNIEDFNRRNDE